VPATCDCQGCRGHPRYVPATATLAADAEHRPRSVAATRILASEIPRFRETRL
jgi:hypothetical protein